MANNYTAEQVLAAFRIGVKLASCEWVMDDKIAERVGSFKDGGKQFLSDIEARAFQEWKSQGRPLKLEDGI